MRHFERMVQSEEIFQGHVLRLTLDRVELEDGSLTNREIVHHHGGAAIVPLDADGSVYLVRQFRYAFGKELLEIPAGKLEQGEDPREAAVRELEEECGLVADQVVSLGEIYPSVGYDNEIIHLYLATGLHTTRANPDQGEFLSLERLPLKTLGAMVMDGTLHDAKTVAAILKTIIRQSKNG